MKHAMCLYRPVRLLIMKRVVNHSARTGPEFSSIVRLLRRYPRRCAPPRSFVNDFLFLPSPSFFIQTRTRRSTIALPCVRRGLLTLERISRVSAKIEGVLEHRHEAGKGQEQGCIAGSLSTCSTGPFFCQSPRDPCNFLSRKPRRGFNAPLSQSALPASSPPLVQRRPYYSQSTPTILTMHRGSHSSSNEIKMTGGAGELESLKSFATFSRLAPPGRQQFPPRAIRRRRRTGCEARFRRWKTSKARLLRATSSREKRFTTRQPPSKDRSVMDPSGARGARSGNNAERARRSRGVSTKIVARPESVAVRATATLISLESPRN